MFKFRREKSNSVNKTMSLNYITDIGLAKELATSVLLRESYENRKVEFEILHNILDIDDVFSVDDELYYVTVKAVQDKIIKIEGLRYE